MTALFVAYSGAAGGAERLLLDVIDAGDAPSWLACPPGALAEGASVRGVPHFALRERSLRLRGGPRAVVGAVLGLAGHALEVRRLIGAAGPDVVVAWSMRSAVCCVLARRWSRRAPPIVFQHNDLLPAGAVAGLVRVVAARCERVVAVSGAVRLDLDPDGRLADRVVTIHPGVDLERFRPLPAPGGEPEVLVLGALVPWKEPMLALEAVARAARALPDIRVRVLGAPLGDEGVALLASLRERATRPDLAGRAEIAGVAQNAEEALARAACLLHTASAEPFGLVVAEALACGRPAVVPAAGGPREIVDASCGRRYPPGDSAAAAERLVEVLGDPERRRALGAGARRRAEAAFSREAARERFARVLADVDPGGEAPPPASTPSFTLLVVTHNSAGHLRALLRSVERFLPGCPVVVVDSGSGDDSVRVARDWPGAASVVELGENVGFGRANNIGMASVGTEVCVLVNPDVELLDGSLAELAREAARRDRSARLLAPVVLRPDGSREDAVQPAPWSWQAALTAVVPAVALPGRVRTWVEPFRSDAPRRGAWAVGACLVARTQTLRELGPFDPAIFLYAEDLDLGLRAAARGVETWHWPAGRVRHAGGHSSGVAFGGEPFERLARMRRSVVHARGGARRGRLVDVLQIVTFAERWALKRALGRPAARERAQLRALRAARRLP